MSSAAGNVVFGIPEEREKQYEDQIRAMNFLDKVLFTELVRTDQGAALSVLRALLDNPLLEYARRPGKTGSLPCV